MLTNATSSALLSLRTLNPYVVGTIRAGGEIGYTLPRQDTQAVTGTTVQHVCQPVMGVSSFAFQVLFILHWVAHFDSPTDLWFLPVCTPEHDL